MAGTTVSTLTLERLRETLDYDPFTGFFRWRERANPKPTRHTRMWNTRWAGTIAGSKNPDGYTRIVIDYTMHRAHRLAWAMTYGEWPDQFIDHINRDTQDNRISNLRKCSNSENNCNAKVRKTNISGYKGVSFCKRTGRWMSFITLKGKSHFLGRFKTPQEAHAAYCKEAATLHGDFARFE